jgi:cytochrome P450
MSVSEASPETRQNGSRAAADGAGGGLGEASILTSTRFVAAALMPTLTRGLFKPRRGASKRLTQLDADRRTVEFLSGVRDKHPGQGVKLFGGRMVVLWGEDAIREVLDQSADAYASDAGAKAKGMCHFQPDALTLSRGEEWRDRRAFTEAVLATSERVHPFAERFLAVACDEVLRLRIGDRLDWDQWERMFDRITLRVVFGDRSRDDQELTDLLEKLMGEANRLVGLSEGDDYHAFYGCIDRHLADPEPDSLVARFADAPKSDRTRVAQQVPHWLFAMRDTLGANAYRALAVIVHDPDVLAKVRAEIDGADLTDPAAIDGLRYLEGCLHEAMRLWATTPLLARETTRKCTLAGEQLDEGTQVMMVNTFNHRDAAQVDDADWLKPERWEDGERDYRFNHLSNGSQDCPGGPLVLLIGKAVIARVLDEYDVRLEQPELKAGKPLPHMLDFFETRFAVEPRS